jgi:hypothetical protein
MKIHALGFGKSVGLAVLGSFTAMAHVQASDGALPADWRESRSLITVSCPKDQPTGEWMLKTLKFDVSKNGFQLVQKGQDIYLEGANLSLFVATSRDAFGQCRLGVVSYMNFVTINPKLTVKRHEKSGLCIPEPHLWMTGLSTDWNRHVKAEFLLEQNGQSAVIMTEDTLYYATLEECRADRRRTSAL